MYGGTLLFSLFFVIGGIPGLWLVERIARRKLLLWTFGIIIVAVAAPAYIPGVRAKTFKALGPESHGRGSGPNACTARPAQARGQRPPPNISNLKPYNHNARAIRAEDEKAGLSLRDGWLITDAGWTTYFDFCLGDHVQ